MPCTMQSGQPFQLLEKEAREVAAGMRSCGSVPCAGQFLLEKVLLHGFQVCRMAQMLFEDLRALHGLGLEAEGRLLCAAMLHDIGQLVSMKGHHKHSYRLLCGDEQTLSLLGEERRPLQRLLACVPHKDRSMTALLARSHRKKEPHRLRGFALLPVQEQKELMVGGALLRIADGLDESHTGSVSCLHAAVEEGTVTLFLSARMAMDAAAEQTLAGDAARALVKGRLFCAYFEKELQWKRA